MFDLTFPLFVFRMSETNEKDQIPLDTCISFPYFKAFLTDQGNGLEYKGWMLQEGMSKISGYGYR